MAPSCMCMSQPPIIEAASQYGALADAVIALPVPPSTWSPPKRDWGPGESNGAIHREPEFC
jgi:hypothetical protein